MRKCLTGPPIPAPGGHVHDQRDCGSLGRQGTLGTLAGCSLGDEYIAYPGARLALGPHGHLYESMAGDGELGKLALFGGLALAGLYALARLGDRL